MAICNVSIFSQRHFLQCWAKAEVPILVFPVFLIAQVSTSIYLTQHSFLVLATCELLFTAPSPSGNTGKGTILAGYITPTKKILSTLNEEIKLWFVHQIHYLYFSIHHVSNPWRSRLSVVASSLRYSRATTSDCPPRRLIRHTQPSSCFSVTIQASLTSKNALIALV